MANTFRKLWRWFAATFATLVILLAVAVGLFRLLLPQVPAYHAQIESWASKAIGLPLTLSSLDARWSFGGPALTFENARLFTGDEQNVLIEAASGSVAISLGDLIRGGKIRPGKVVLTGTRLSLERNEEGILHLTGQAPPQGGAKRAMAPVFQVLPRGNFELRDASIIYVDHSAGYGPWRFSEVDLVIDHGRAQLLIEGSAQLPSNLGENVNFKLSTRDSLLKPLAIRWQASIHAEQLNMKGVGDLLPAGMPDVVDGRMDVVSNLALVGRDFEHLSSNFSIRDFSFLAAQKPDREDGWSHLSGLLEWDRQSSGWKASLNNLLVERSDQSWPLTKVNLERTASSNNSVEIVYLDASYIRLQDLSPLKDWLPEGEARNALLALAPRGELQELVISRSLREGATTSYALRSEFSNLVIDPYLKLPGVENLSGKLRMDDAGGYLELETTAASLALDSFYSSKIAVNSMVGNIGWHRDNESWVLTSDDLQIDTPAFSSRTDFSLTLPGADESPVLQLESRILDLNLMASRDYLPEKKMPPMAYRWLQGALVSGHAPETTISFDGPVRAYPFKNNEGRFSARTNIEDMRFAFARVWPAVDGARIETVFENGSMRARIISGSMLGNDVSGSTAEIADLAENILIVQGQSRGTVNDLLGFMRASPLANVLGPRLNDVRGAGGAQTELVVNLPLTDMEKVRVNGNTALQADWLGIDGLEQRFTQVNGDINFTEKAVRATDIKARLFGRNVSMDIRPGSDANGVVNSTLIDATGRHSSTDLVGNLPFPVPVVLDGEMNWRATARFPKSSVNGDSFDITVESGMVGMAVILPEPARKPAADTRRMSLQFRFPAEGEISLASAYGNIMTGKTRFLKTADEWRHDRSAVNLGGPPPELPLTEGLVVTGDGDRLDLDQWIKIEWGDDLDPDAPPLLRSANIQIRRLHAYGQVISDAKLKLDRNAREWLAQINSERIEGSLLIPVDRTEDDRVFADMVRLILMPEDEATRTPTSDPRTLPAMRIVAREFVYDDMNFGSLEAEVVKTPNGLSVASAKTRDPGFSIDGHGRWEVLAGEEASAFDFTLTASDVRRALVQLAFDPIMTADDAAVTASVHWPGPPDRSYKEKISGSVSVRVGDGQLLEVEPGAGRMFGLLSIAALPRRLSLDFRDVFDSGFGFDSISGTFELVEGQAYTNNLVLDGPAADIGIAGRAGIADRDYDQIAVVRANLGSALPLAGVIAAGPAVGAALLIFSEILKDPLKDMSKVFYKVTGSWDAPDIQQVDQALADAPVPEAGSPQAPDPGGG